MIAGQGSSKFLIRRHYVLRKALRADAMPATTDRSGGRSSASARSEQGGPKQQETCQQQADTGPELANNAPGDKLPGELSRQLSNAFASGRGESVPPAKK